MQSRIRYCLRVMDPAVALAELLAEAAARRQRGEPARDAHVEAADAAQLLVALGGGDDGGFDRFFAALGAGLRARGATLPPLDQLPASVVPLIAAAGAAFIVDDAGAIDAERTAANLDRTARRAFGSSPRTARAAQLRAQIRTEVAASVAASMRAGGLTPAIDLPGDAADDGDGDGDDPDAQ